MKTKFFSLFSVLQHASIFDSVLRLQFTLSYLKLER